MNTHGQTTQAHICDYTYVAPSSIGTHPHTHTHTHIHAHCSTVQSTSMAGIMNPGAMWFLPVDAHTWANNTSTHMCLYICSINIQWHTPTHIHTYTHTATQVYIVIQSYLYRYMYHNRHKPISNTLPWVPTIFKKCPLFFITNWINFRLNFYGYLLTLTRC